MPVINRTPHKLIAKGLDLTNPPDLMPPGLYPRLMNAAVVQAGAIDCRPGSTTLSGGYGSPGHGHTLRRLNNLNPSYSSVSHILLAGIDTGLYAGDPPGTSPIATGFSGNPLSCIIYRPDQSTAAWAYIADQNKLVKVDVNSTVRNVGILSPAIEPSMEIDHFGYQDVSLAPAWVAGGTAGASSTPSRVPALTTLSVIKYDSGSTGWACISASTPTGDYGWLQAGERLILNAAETVEVQSVLPEIPSCTIASILYDSGTTGLCSITLSSKSPNLARNSLLDMSEVVRVLDVETDTLGNISFRCNIGAHTVGEVVGGLVSFRCFTTTTIAAGNTITDGITLQWTNATGIGFQTHTAAQPDLSEAAGRALGPDDIMHVSVWVSNPALLTEGRVMLDVDPVTNTFAQNYFYYAFRANDLTAASQATQPATAAIQTSVVNQTFASADPRNASTQINLGSGQWCELTFRIADLIRVGTDTTRTLADVAAIRFLVTTTASMTVRFNSWYVTGGYGADVALGSPTGIFYLYRYRSTVTGARSNPSPAPRYQLFPSRESIGITCTTSTDAQVDVIDIFRYDPSLQSANTPTATIVYLATVPNSSPTYSDQQVASLIAANEQVETNLYNPWPVLAAPLSGLCNISGSTVKRVSGSLFPLSMVPGTVITLGSASRSNHQTFSYPRSTGFLELQDNGGAGTNVPFSVYSPLLTGQPLPILFGPLEGPLATYTFGLGDPANPGTLYWTNGNDPDSASDQNTIEITSPSEPLIGGVVWNTLVYVFSRDRIFLVRPSFDASGTFTFTFYALQSPSGLWSSWALCAGIDGVYFLGRDGIYRIAGEAVVSVTDDTLYPLFPHAHKPAVALNGFNPVDMTATSYLQLNFADGDIWFHYKDVAGVPV